MLLIKQVASVDVAQKELVCTFGTIDTTMKESLKSREVFQNNSVGFKKFQKWVQIQVTEGVGLEVIMEPTGVYHEKFAHFLYNNKFKVVIVMPNKIANYTKSLNLKTITDKTASEAICRFGLKHNLDSWVPAKPIFKQMQQLTRERSQMINERGVLSNQIHSLTKQALPSKSSLKRMEKRKKTLIKDEKQLENELKLLVLTDDSVNQRVKRIMTIPGVGFLTAVTILAETNGFELIKNTRQLVSYAGLDIVQKQSGTSINKKAKISKKGNVHLRKALFYPAFTAVSTKGFCKTLQERISNESGAKMKGYVAVQKKILELAYILDKSGQDFEMNYHQKVKTQQKVESLESSLC
jgi:transposase